MNDTMETVKRRAWRAVERQLALEPAERHPVVQTALTGATWVYAHVSSQKRLWQLARRQALPVRTISFGNVTWGGTGKTPCLHHVARMVHSTGHDLLLVSRGYGDDEWRMFAAEFPHSLLAIGKHRYANAMARLTGHRRDPEATNGGPNQVVALIDDGLQQWGLQKDLEIVMVDCYNPFGNGLLIPAGRLRELPEEAFPSADIVVLHHATHLERTALTQLQTAIQRLARPDTVIAHSRMRLTGLPLGSQLDQHTHDRHQLHGEAVAPHDNLTVIGLCGIGCPQSFRNTLEGAFPTAHDLHVHAFPDHHAFSAADLSPVLMAIREADASGRSAVVVTTEKDYFRSKALLNAHLPDLRVALCDLEFTHGGDVVRKRVQELLRH